MNEIAYIFFAWIHSVSAGIWLGGSLLYLIKSIKYSDKNILINFWFPSCPPCIYELDILDDIHQKYDSVGVIGVQVLGLDNKEDGKKMLEKKEISYKSIADESDVIIDLLQINVFPTTILFDTNGNEINRWVGIIDEQIVSKKISEIE